MVNTFFAARSDIVLDQLRNVRLEAPGSPPGPLYPDIGAPVFNQHGGTVNAGFDLLMSGTGTIYYTTDGSDPRDYDPVTGITSIAATASNFAVSPPDPLTETTVVAARILDAGQWSALNEALFIVIPPTAPSIAVTEINYNPHAPTDDELTALPGVDNDEFEFIEIQNVDPSETINVGGFSLSGGITFTFPVASLGPGEFAVVVEDAAAFQERYGSSANVLGEWSGGLSNGGEQLSLADGSGNTILDFEYNDNDPWPERADGAGGTIELSNPMGTPSEHFGKYYAWRGSTRFGGSPGSAGVEPIGVVINEILAHTDPPITLSDSIELFNPTDTAIDIGGWFLSDAGGNLRKYEIPSGTMLAAGAYLVFDENDFNPIPENPGANDFALSGANGDDVYLIVPDENDGVASFVDDVHFGASRNGEAFGRVPNGAGRLAPMSELTLGSDNSEPRIGPLVISEVNYQPGDPSAAALEADPEITPSDLEFVEIHNPTNAAESLTDWRIRGGIDFEFADDVTIGAGDTLVVISFDPGDLQNADRLSAFRAQYNLDDSVMILGGYAGQLSDNGERVQLQRPDEPPAEEPTLIPRLYEDELLYDNLSPWPISASGFGDSLQRGGAESFGNSASSWVAAAPSPGTVNFSTVPGDLTGDGTVDAADINALFGAINEGNMSTEFDLDGDGLVGQSDVTFLVESIIGSFMGDATLDGKVDAADLNRVGLNWQTIGEIGWEGGDFNGDRQVNASDLNVVGINWLQGVPAAGPVANQRIPRAPLAMNVGASEVVGQSGDRDTIQTNARRGSPDPAASPTAGLSESAQPIAPGDLRSTHCAGSGDPRTAFSSASLNGIAITWAPTRFGQATTYDGKTYTTTVDDDLRIVDNIFADVGKLRSR